MCSETMEAIVALNMGNILNFYLDHSNYYLFFLFKFKDPLISLIIGTHNVRLEPSVSMQKLVLKNLHRVLINWQNSAFQENVKNILPFCKYLWTRCMYFQIDFCNETLGSSRSFGVP